MLSLAMFLSRRVEVCSVRHQRDQLKRPRMISEVWDFITSKLSVQSSEALAASDALLVISQRRSWDSAEYRYSLRPFISIF